MASRDGTCRLTPIASGTVDTWFPLLLVVLLIAANAVFVAAEFALVTVDRSEVRQAAEQGDRRARGISAALSSLSTQLSGAQVGITVTSLIVGFLSEPAIARLLQGPLESWGLPESTALAVSLTAALIIATVTQMVFGELIPKNWAIAQPRRVANVVTPLQRSFTAFAGPLISLTNGNANWLLRRMGIEPVEELSAGRSPNELQALVLHSASSGTLEQDTADLLGRSLRFGERQAEDVMTPRTRMSVLRTDDTAADVLRACEETGLSRFPVVGREGADDVRGVVSLRTALRVPEAQRSVTRVGTIMADAARIPESLPLDDVLPQVRGGNHLIVVVDEYGGTAGIVTLEDLVEELVGEVADEYDRPNLHGRRQGDGSWALSGLLRPDEARTMGVPIPDHPDYETIAGFLLQHLGRMAVVGDIVEHAGWLLEVDRLDGLRIDRITATPAAVPLAGRDGAGSPTDPTGEDAGTAPEASSPPAGSRTVGADPDSRDAAPEPQRTDDEGPGRDE